MSNLICEANDPTPYYLRNLPDIKVLNLKEVMNDVSLHVSLRNFCAYLLEAKQTNQPYRSTGSFFYGLPNFAVNDLYSFQEGFDEDYSGWLVSNKLDEQLALKNLTTLALVLANAEGMPDIAAKVLQEALPNLVALIKLEHAYRQGLAVVDYKQYSLFDADMLKPGNFMKEV